MATDPTSYLSPYTISGGMNFGSAAGLGDYQGAYQNALNLNQQLYNNILGGYQGLTNSVLGNIQGVAAGQEQNINDIYAQQQGAATQNLISKGLGNTTVASSVARGIGLDKTKALNNLQSQIASLYANTQSQLGQGMLNWMNSVAAPYPNPQAYMQYAMNQGMLNAMKRGIGTNQFGGLGGGGYRVVGSMPPLRGAGSMWDMGGGTSGYAGGFGLPAYSNRPPQTISFGAGGGGSWDDYSNYGNAWDFGPQNQTPNLFGQAANAIGGYLGSYGGSLFDTLNSDFGANAAGQDAFGYGYGLGGQLGNALGSYFGGGQPAGAGGAAGVYGGTSPAAPADNYDYYNQDQFVGPIYDQSYSQPTYDYSQEDYESVE